MNPLLILIGIFLSIIGYFSLRKNQKLSKEGVKVMAKVIDISEDHSSDSEGYSSTSYYPILEFKDENSTKHSFKGNVGGGKRKYHLDQEIEILYDPQKPDNAQMKSVMGQWITPIIIIIVGIMLVVGGVVGG